MLPNKCFFVFFWILYDLYYSCMCILEYCSASATKRVLLPNWGIILHDHQTIFTETEQNHHILRLQGNFTKSTARLSRLYARLNNFETVSCLIQGLFMMSSKPRMQCAKSIMPGNVFPLVHWFRHSHCHFTCVVLYVIVFSIRFMTIRRVKFIQNCIVEA